MKKVFLSGVFVLCFFTLFIGEGFTAVSVQIIKQFGTSSSDEAKGITKDGSGNIYVAGETYGKLPGVTDSYGNYDIFLRKYDNSLNEIWTKQYGTSDYEYANSAKTDSLGNVYISGYRFANLSDNDKGILYKIDPSGNVAWQITISSVNYDCCINDIAIDSLNNIYALGYYTETSVYKYHDFLNKYDSSGNLQWTRSTEIYPSTGSIAYGFSVAIDNQDNVYVGGYTDGHLRNYVNAGMYDGYICKYNNNGNLLWSLQEGTTNYDYITGITVDNSNNLFAVNIELGFTQSDYYYKASIMKLNSSGGLLWSKPYGTNKDIVYKIKLDGYNNIYTCGNTTGIFPQETSYGNYDAFVTKHDSSGNMIWAKQFGSAGDDMLYDMIVISSDNVLCTGYTYGILPYNVSYGQNDAFIAGIAEGTISTDITVAIPKGNETLYTGEKADIVWWFQGAPGNVKIDLSTDSCASWTNLAYDTPCDGIENVLIPALPVTPVSTCMIRVQSISNPSLMDISDSNFTIDQRAPALTLIYPDENYSGTQIFQVGQQVEIKWSWQGIINGIAIDLSTDGGSTWNNLISNTSNDGSEFITIPQITNTPNSRCRIMIKDVSSSAQDFSSYNFLITDPNGAPGIAITYPRENYGIRAEIPFLVIWTTQGNIPNVNIDFSNDDGATWTRLVTDITNDGNESVVIPKQPNYYSPDSRIRVSDTDGDPYGISEKIHVSNSLRIIYPNGGEILTEDQDITVEYNKDYYVGNVNIELSFDSGNIWTNLALNISSWSYCSVKLPNIGTQSVMTCKIRAKQTAGNIYDESDNNFTITKSTYLPPVSITVVFPNGGERFTTGQQVTALWTSNNYTGDINIELSTDDGTTWTNLVSNTSNDGNEIITMPQTTSTVCILKIRSISNNPSDISNTVFAIESVPVIWVSTTSINFGVMEPADMSATVSFNMLNQGGGTLTGSITTDQGWIKVSPASFSANTMRIDVTLENNMGKAGQYKGKITIDSNGGTKEIEVSVEATCVLAKPNPVKAGQHITFFGDGIVPGKTTIKIYTLSGELVKTIGNVQSAICNVQLDLCPGIYIYIYESPKEKGVAKFTVIP